MHKSIPSSSASRRSLDWRASFNRLRASATTFSISALLLGAALAPSVKAANDAWSTNPADNTFTGINWTTGTNIPGAPTGTIGAGDSLYFGTSNITTLNENELAGFNIASFTFNAGASAYVINGNSFALGVGGITNNGTNLETINDAFTMAATSTFTTTAGGGDLALGGGISGAGGITLAGTGTTTLSGLLAYTGTTTLNGGTLTITNGGTIGPISLSAGATTGVLNLAPTSFLSLGAGNLVVGGNAASVGVVNQTTGTVATSSQINLGNANGAYGAYNISGGTLNTAGMRNGGYNNGLTGNTRGASTNGNFSYFNQTGGVVNNSGSAVFGYQGTGTSVFYLNGGTFNIPTNNNFFLGYDAGATGIATINSGTLNIGVTNTNAPLRFNDQTNATTATGIFNLNGGTLQVGYVSRGVAGTSIFNFNGGVLQGKAANTGFFGGSVAGPTLLTSANVYSGGAKIDSNGFALTVVQPLITTGGTTGVSSAGIIPGGIGYVAAPVVTITGTGTGATAIATINAAGQVTGIQITSAGTGYTGTPTYTLTGGGGTGAVVTGNLSLAANAATDGGLTKLGLGTLTLTGANTYNGGTFINGGAIQFSAATAVPATGLITINSAGALNTAATGSAFTTVASALGGGQIATGSTGAIALTGNSTEAIDFATPGYNSLMLGASVNSTFTGTINPGASGYHLGGGGATLTLSNANTLTGANALTVGAAGSTGTVLLTNTNNYTGGTTINGSTLQFATTAAMPAAGAVTVNSGGTLAVNAGGAGQFTNATSGAGSIGGLLAGTGGQGAPVTFNGGSALGIDTTGAVSPFTYAGNITNAGVGITKLGTGTLNFSGANTYTGATTVSAGTLQAGVASVAGVSGAFGLNSPVTLAAGTTLDLNTFNTQIGSLTGGGAVTLGAAALTVGGDNTSPATYSGVLSGANGSLTKTGTGTLLLTGNNTFTGPTTVNNGTIEFGAGGGLYTTGTVAGAVAVNAGGTLRFSRSDALGGSGGISPVVVTVNGGTLASNNSYTSLSNLVLNGATITTNGGTSLAFPGFSLRGTVTVGGTAPTNINIGSAGNGFTNITLGTLSGTSPGDVVTFNVADATSSALSDLNVNTFFNNQSTGAVGNGLTKSGAGTMTLNGANTYTGPTVVNAGNLVVSGSTAAASAVTVNNAGTMLSGTGNVAGAVTVNTGAIISAGNRGAATPTPGTLTTGALTLQTGSTFDALLASNTSFSTLTAAGMTALGNAAFSITLTPGATFTSGQVLTLITSNVTGQFTNSTFTAGGFNFAADYTTNPGLFDVDVTAVPEPATWVAGGLLVSLLGLSQRRKVRGLLDVVRA